MQKLEDYIGGETLRLTIEKDTLFTVISFMRGKWGIEFCEELRFNIECNFFASANTMLDTKNNSSYKTLCKTFIAELALIVCEAQARQE